MIQIPRWPMVTTAFLLGLLHVGIGVYWSGRYSEPIIGLAGVLLYLIPMSMTILGYKSKDIPSWQGLVNLLVATALPRIIESQVTPELYGTYATWYVGALGVLLGATALRGQLYFAWGGFVIATTEILLWEKPQNFLNSGWTGLLILIVIGQAANIGLKVSEAEIEQATSRAAVAALSATRAETIRKTQQKTFGDSVPNIQTLLRRAIAQKGRLSEDDRREALLLEDQLSDEVMGGELVSKAVSRAARMARLRGVEVYLIDQGVLSLVSKAELQDILKKVEDVIDEQMTGKVTVRATFGNRWRVSITAFERGAKIPNVDWKF